MDLKEGIKQSLEKIVFGISHENIPVEVSLSQDFTFGDFTTNIALQISKNLGENPRNLAEEIKEKVKESEFIKDYIEKVEVAGPGFINFYLKKSYLIEGLNKIDNKFGQSNNKSEKIIVEFGDPNPFKQIHIGHLRNFCIGESFSRLLESQGNSVIRANYQGDVGLHVAKAIYGILNSPQLKDKYTDLSAGDLANAYAFGSKEFEVNEQAKIEIQRLNKMIYEENSEVIDLWEKGRKVSLEDFEKLYARIGIKYDKYFFESETAKRGKEVVIENIDNGIFEKDESTVIYRGEKDGLHTRVFLTKEGYATYEAKDLALAIIKDENIPSDKSVILTGNEQTEYFQVMLSALNKIREDISKKTLHLTFGHVRLKDGKMSSRTGDVITADWLISEAINKIKQNFPDIDDNTAEKIGLGAVKYSMLKFGVASDIHFDFKESISLEGNSGPYIQYTYVRTQSILKNKFKDENLNQEIDLSLNLEEKEEELIRTLYQYPYVLEEASNNFAPNVLCNYLFELSQLFNIFYQRHKVVGSEKENFRIRLTNATGQIIENSLGVLGIDSVKKM